MDQETQSTIAMGFENHGLFRLVDFGDSKGLAMAVKLSSFSTLWHQWYGHLNVHYLSQLVQEDLVIGQLEIQTKNLGVRRACQAGKQHRTPFINSSNILPITCAISTYRVIRILQ